MIPSVHVFETIANKSLIYFFLKISWIKWFHQITCDNTKNRFKINNRIKNLWIKKDFLYYILKFNKTGHFKVPVKDSWTVSSNLHSPWIRDESQTCLLLLKLPRIRCQFFKLFKSISSKFSLLSKITVMPFGLGSW